MPRNRTGTSEQNKSISFGPILAGGLTGLLLTGLFTFSAAVLLHLELLPVTVCNWLGPVIIALSSLIAAWSAARARAKKLLLGLLSAGFYGLALVICGMLLFSAPIHSGRMLLSTGALLLGMLGGIVLSALRE